MMMSPLMLVLAAVGCSAPSDREPAPEPAPVAAPQAAPAAAPGGAFVLPIACEPGRDCEVQNYVDRDPGAGALDYRGGSMTYDDHSGLDIRLHDLRAQARGVAVLAAADGVVLRARDGVQDVSVDQIGQAAVDGTECGNGLVIEHAGGLTTQYCHMARGSLRVRPGDRVTAGQPVGAVGLSGNTEYPHLHFTVRRDDRVIDPFDPGEGPDLWASAADAALAYKAGAILNAGFAAGRVSMDEVEAGSVAPAGPAAPALVAYVRAIGLRAGDRQSLSLTAPGGQVLAQTQAEPLPRHQAQRLLFVGKPRPASGWASGTYTARYAVERDGRVALERTFTVTF